MPNGPDDDEGFPTGAEISRMEPETRETPMSYRRSVWPVAVTIGAVLLVAIIIFYYFAR